MRRGKKYWLFGANFILFRKGTFILAQLLCKRLNFFFDSLRYKFFNCWKLIFFSHFLRVHSEVFFKCEELMTLCCTYCCSFFIFDALSRFIYICVCEVVVWRTWIFTIDNSIRLKACTHLHWAVLNKEVIKVIIIPHIYILLTSFSCLLE